MPRSHRKKYLLIGIITAVVVLLVGATVFMLMRGGNSFIGQLISPTHKDWLKPESEIKLGDTRYISPCQALSLSDVRSLAGAPASDGNISEFYYDQSPSETVRSISSSCKYTLNKTELSSIELKVDQFRDASRVKLDSKSILPSPTAIERGLSAYEDATKSSSDKAVKDFVQKMSESSQMVIKYDEVFEESELGGFNLDGLLVPTSDAIYFTVGNDIYTLKYSYNGTKTDAGYISRIKQIKKTIDVIKKNVADKTLSQSPAPTILSGSDTYGDALVLESCAIFTPQVFTTATGLSQNDQVFRFGYVNDISKDRVARIDKTPLLPDSQCTRKYTPYNDPLFPVDAASVGMKYTLSLARSSDAAQKWIDETHPTQQGDVALQTTADWARQSALADLLGTGASPQLYMFRVGSYIGQVSINKTQSGGLDSDINQSSATPAEHVKAINALVESLKANVKTAQSSR